MLTIAEVRERLPVSRRTIYALIAKSDFPKPARIPGMGPKVFFDPDAVATWLKAHGYESRA